METFLTARSRRCLALVEISRYTWTCGHRFSMDSWHHIYTDIISFQSWNDWLVTHFINKSESTYEVVVREVLGAYCRVSGQLPFSPLLFHEIDLLLSAFPFFIIIEQYSVQNYTLLHIWEGSTSTYHIPSWHVVQYRECSDK